jgi:hypothetical protein
MKVFTVGELYFRILAEPNEQRAGRRAWRLKELAERATALSGRQHVANNISGHLRTGLRKRGEAHSVNEGGHVVWSLTEKARSHERMHALRICGCGAADTLCARLTCRLALAPPPPRRACSTQRSWAFCATRPCRCPASHCRRRWWQMLRRLHGRVQQRCWLPRRRRSARHVRAHCVRLARYAVRAPRLPWRLYQCRRTYFERQCADDTSCLGNAFQLPAHRRQCRAPPTTQLRSPV